MKKNLILSSIIVLSALSFSTANADQTQSFKTFSQPTANIGYNYDNAKQTYTTPLKGSVIVVPASTIISAVTASALDTQTMVAGQNISLVLPAPFMYANKIIAPAGSTVNGVVITNKNAAFAGRNATLFIRFNSILTPYGQSIPISGRIKTDDGTGVIHGGTKFDTAKDYAKDVAVGAAAGAVMGTIMGPLSGGKVGKGAALGTAVGAGSGLVKSLFDKGGSVSIPANSIIDIVLDQPASCIPSSVE